MSATTETASERYQRQIRNTVIVIVAAVALAVVAGIMITVVSHHHPWQANSRTCATANLGNLNPDQLGACIALLNESS